MDTASVWLTTGLQEAEEKMIRTAVPKEHQALGRKVKGYDGKIWDQSMP